MLTLIGKLIILCATVIAIILALCIIFLCIACFIISKDDKEYEEAIKEIEDKGDINE